MLRLAVRAKGSAGALFAVTDAMPTVHGPPQFELYGATIRLRDGRLIDARGSLAGVHIDMVTTVRRLVRNVELPLQTALAMGPPSPPAPRGCRQGTAICGPAPPRMWCCSRVSRCAFGT